MQHAYSRFWRLFGLAALSAGLLTGTISPASAQWVTQNTNFPATSTGVGQIEVVNASTVWITGFDGSGGGEIYNDFSRTVNGGATWVPGTVGPAAGLGFANISAVSSTTAWAAMLNTDVGGGRLYATTNGGTSWVRQLMTGFPAAQGGYLNAVRMYSATNGIVMGDPITPANEFEIYTTTTGGTTWTPVAAASLPNPLTGEFSFLDALVIKGTSNAWFGTSKGRVYRSTTGGTSWDVATTGLNQINELAFSSATEGLAMELDNAGALVGLARTTDGGSSWSLITPAGTVYTSDLQAVPGAVSTFVTAGARPNNTGSAVSTDGGLTWANLQTGVQRTAIGAADASTVWGGSYTLNSAGGIVKGNLTPAPRSAPDWDYAQGTGAGSVDDIASGVFTDAAGNAFVTGRFNGTLTFGTTTLTSAGENDGYLAKYNPQGAVQWARRFGGVGSDIGRDVVVDANGNAYISGLFRVTATFGAISVTSAGDADAFVAKYNSAGDVQWVRTGGGGALEVAYQVSVDGANNVYISGVFGDTGLLNATFSGTTIVSAGGSDAYAASYTDAGALRWVIRGGNTGDEYAIALAVTTAGDVTISGPYGISGVGGGGTTKFGSTTLTSAGGTDGFVARYNNAGTFQWARSFGGIEDDGANSAAVDAAGNIYLAGYFRGDIIFGGTTATSEEGAFNVLILSYTSAGTPRWVQHGGGVLGDSGYQLTTDASGNAYVTGFFQGPSTFGSVVLTSTSGADMMVVKCTSATGAVEWVTTATGDNNEFGRGITVDPVGAIYVVGSFDSPILTFTQLIKRTRVGGIDGYLAKLKSTCTLLAPTVTVNGPICVGQTLTLTATGVPASGVTVQWSGPNGFTANTVVATVPNATAAATGTYTFTVSSAAQGCSRSATVTATVEAAPAAPAATATFRRCGPGTLTLTVQSATGTTFAWYTVATGGAPIAGATSATYTTPSLSATTTYYVSASNAAGCESARTAVIANVEAVPTVSVAANGPLTFCAGGSVVLTASSTSTVSYLWSTGATTASITITAAGSYTVTATNAGSCAATSAATVVSVTPAPAAPTATGASRCGVGTVTLTASGRPTGGAFAWYTTATGGTPIAGATSGLYTTPSLSATTTYYVSTLTSNGCESPRVAVVATVSATPTVSLTASGATTFCEGGSVTLTAAGTAGVTYQFYQNGTLVPSTGNTYSATQSGAYTVKATTTGSCEATSTAVNVTVNPVANATFAYASNTICLGATPTATPTISGTRGGTFSISPATGVAINASTGALTLTGATSGTYQITYAVSGVCPASSTQAVTLTTSPTAAFTYGPTSLCTGAGTTAAPVLATGASAGRFTASPAGLSLNAQTGVIDLGASAAGTYTVTNSLAASGSCPAAQATSSVTVSATPTAPTATGASRCGDGTLTLTAAGGAAGGAYAWYTMATGGTPIAGATGATYTTPSLSATTSYYVSSRNAVGCESPRVAVVATVNAAPTVSLTASGATTFCEGGSVTPTAAGTAGVTYQFYQNGTLVPSTGNTYSATQSGAYTVKATTTGSCEATSTAVNVTANPLPTVALTASGPTTFCAGDSLMLTAAGSAGATYQFYQNGTPIAGATGSTYNVTASGVYTVIATSAATCEATSTAVTVTVNPATSATFAYATTQFCLGSTASVTPTIGGTAGGTFSVSPATGVTIDPVTGGLTLTGATAGSYTITYSVSGPCPSTSSQDITLTTAPIGAFTYAQASYCTGGGATDSPALATGATAGTFSATPAGLTIDATTGVIDLNTSAAGTYSVVNTLAASGACGAVRDSVTVTVEATPAQPTASATTQGPLVLLTSSATTGNQWYLGGVPVVGATGQTLLVTAASQSGVYTVVVTTGNCPSLPSAGLTVTVTGTIAELAKATLQLYPNPTTDGRVTLELATSATPTALTVFDAAGRAVLRATLPAHTTRYELDAHRLPVGVYAVRVGTAVRRLVRD